MRLALHLSIVTVLAVGPAVAEPGPRPSGWTGPLNGIAVAVPEGWSARIEDTGVARSLELTCLTEACRSTQETCTVTVVDRPIPQTMIPSAWLVRFTIGSEIAENLVDGAKEGTQVTTAPHGFWAGPQSWYGGETLAPYGWKSRFQATAVISGRFVKVRCGTCERSEERFDFARSLLEKVRLAR